MTITGVAAMARSAAATVRGRVLVAAVLVPAIVLAGVTKPPKASAAPAANVASTAGLSSLKSMSYFPSNAGWTYMWQSWNPAQINSDFAKIAAMSANAVRVVVQPSAMGWPVPTAAMQSEVDSVIAMAAANRLQVELTLFDWWGSYADTSSSDRWVTALLHSLQNDPRLAFIELQNEIKPEDPAAMAWAAHEIPVVKALAGTIPVTVSVTDDAQFSAIQELQALKAALVATPVDFYDVHLYTTPGTAYAYMAQAQAVVAPTPLYVGEIGLSSIAAGTPGSQAQAEALQDQYVRTVEWGAKALGLPAPAPWIFQDFTAAGVPPQASLLASGYDYGLVRLDGSTKPAGNSLASIYATGTTGTDINNGFESAAGGLPTNWQVYHANEATFSWDPTVSHTGQASVRLSQTSSDLTGTPAFYTTPVVSPTQAGQQFEATVWAKGSAASGTSNIAVSWFDATNNYVGESDSSPLPSGTTNWTQLSTVATAPVNAAYAQIYLKSANNTGTVWFDDVTFAPFSITLNNPGFEQIVAGLPTSWSLNRPTQATFASDSTVSHTGLASVSIRNATGDSTGTPAFVTAPVISPLNVGEQFTASVWAEGSVATGTSTVSVSWFDAGSNFISGSQSPSMPTGTTGWAQLAVVTSVPAGATSAQIGLTSAHNTGTVWFDDVTLSPSVITVYNAGFEQGAGSSPAGWQVYRPTQGTFNWDSSVSHGGMASVSITKATGDGTGAPAFTTTPIITPLRVGQQFQASAWVEGNATTGVSNIAVSWFDATNHYLNTTASISLPSGTTNWQQLMVVASVPANAAYAQIDLQSLGNTGTVWFDDVTLTPFTLTLFNAGFELGSGAIAAGWEPYHANQGTLNWDSTVSHSGVSSVSLTNTTGDPTGTPSFFTTPIINPLQAGQQFQASAWAKGDATSGLSVVAVSWFDASSTYLGQNSSRGLPSGTTPWTQLSVVVTAPATAAYAQIFVKSANNTGTVWFDDVTFAPYALSVYNASFEQGAGSTPAGWQQFLPTEGTLTLDPTVAHTGTNSVKLSRTTGDSTGAPSFFTTPAINPTQAGQQFLASVWAEGSAETGTATISVAWYGPGNLYLGADTSTPVASGTTPWTQLSVVTTTPATAVYAEIFVKSANNTGTVWFDDVGFVPYTLAINNPVFNQGAGLTPAAWQQFDATLGTLAWDTTVSHSSQASVSLSATGGTAANSPAFVASPIISPLQPGQQFQAAAWAEGAAVTGTSDLAVTWFNAAGTAISTDTSAPLPSGTTTWAPLSVLTTAPATAASATIALQSSTNTGKVWFDDVTLVPMTLVVQNAGFETGTASTPAGWQQYHATQGTFNWDTAVSHSGSASVSLRATTGDSTGVPSFITTPVISPLQTGQQYQATVWAKGSAATGSTTLGVSWFNTAGTYLSGSTSPALANGTTTWTHLSLIATVPAGAAYPQIFLKSGNNTGTVWFDDVTLGPVTLTVSNADFEQGAGTMPAGWQETNPTQGTFNWDNAVRDTGTSSVSLSATGDGTNGVPAFVTTPVIRPVQAGQQFAASVFAKGPSSTGTNTLAVSWYSSAGTNLGATTSAPLPTGALLWTPLSVVTTVPAGAAYAQIALQSTGNTGTVWFDTVSFNPFTLIVNNSDFEQGAGSSPAGWLQFRAAQGTFNWDTTVAHGGLASVSLTATTGDSTGTPSFYEPMVVSALHPAEQFHLSVWAKGSNSTGTNTLAISWLNATGGYISASTTTLLPGGTTGWTQLSVNTTAPAGAASAQIYLKSANNSGTVWFDDVVTSAIN